MTTTTLNRVFDFCWGAVGPVDSGGGFVELVEGVFGEFSAFYESGDVEGFGDEGVVSVAFGGGGHAGEGVFEGGLGPWSGLGGGGERDDVVGVVVGWVGVGG